MAREDVTVVATGVSPVTLSSGRTLAPTDGPAVLAGGLEAADQALVDAGQLVVLPAAGKKA